MHSWVRDKLEARPYIYEFSNQTARFGFCFHLSNGVKAVVFNDKTIMAIMESSKNVVYIQPAQRIEEA